MSVAIAATRTGCATTVSTQDITTTDLGGLTPKAAIIIVSRSTADATALANAVISFGMAISTTSRWRGGVFSKSAVTTTVTGGTNGSAACVTLTNGDGTNEAVADFSAWLTNGIRLNWTTAPTSAYLITVLFFAGSDVTVQGGLTSITAAVNTAQTITTTFLPDFVIAQTSSNNYRESLGFVDFGTSIVQMCIAECSRTAATTTNEWSIVYTDKACASLANQATAALSVGFEFGSPTSSSFTVTPRTNAGGSTGLMWLAVSLGGAAKHWVGLHTTPTATGVVSDNQPDFRPQAIFQLQSCCEVAGTFETGTNAGPWAIAVATPTTSYCNSQSRQDNVATSKTQSLSDDQLVNLPDEAGAALFTGALNGFGAGGWSTDYTAVAGVAKLWPTLVIGETLVKAPPLMSRPLRIWKKRR